MEAETLSVVLPGEPLASLADVHFRLGFRVRCIPMALLLSPHTPPPTRPPG